MNRQHSDAELAACAWREYRYRRRVYKRLVGEHKMTAADADHEISMMKEIAETFAQKNQPYLI